MTELYLVKVYGDSYSEYEEYFDEKEIEIIQKFFDTMESKVASYDIPCIEFEKKPIKIKRRDFAGFRGFGYWACIENDMFVIGYECGREGGTLYSGEYKGINTPYMIDIKGQNLKMYNSIVKYYGY